MAVPATLATQMDSKQFLLFKDWETMDTSQERWGLPPTRLAWLENLQILARNKLRTVPGPGKVLGSIAGATIYRKFSVTFNNADYIIDFTTDGAGYATNILSGTPVQFAPPGTFTDPDVTTWKAQRIVIADPSASYATWDGKVFVQSGGVSPNIIITAGGTGYLTAPIVTISGGSGTGATATCTILNGSVFTIQLTNPGVNYRAGDVLTVTFSGSGSGAAATAIVFPVFSQGFSTIAVAFGRVWLGGGLVLQFTGTQGFDDAAQINAAGFTVITDTDLAHRITGLRNLNNFLYIFGDNSIKQIGNVTVSGQQTLFAITTLSSDTGTVFPRSIQSYNRVVTFANWEGIWQLFGASIQKISDEMDGVFDLIDFSLDLQGFVATINNRRVYCLLVRYMDPVQGNRSIMLTRQEKRWFVVSQGPNLRAVCAAVVNGKRVPFGSTASDITPILADATVPVPILVRTALDPQNKEMLGKRQLRIGVTQFVVSSGTLTMTTDSENGVGQSQNYNFGVPVIWLNNSQQVVTWLNNSNQLVTWVAFGFLFQEAQANASGIYLGASLSGTVVGLRLSGIVIEYEDTALMRSRNK